MTVAATSTDSDHNPHLGDYSTNRRVLLLVAMAVAIACISTGAAFVLVRLIALITNLVFHHRISVHEAIPAGHHLGLWVVLMPVAGALIIGLMARYGSSKIRGHGIPEALEAILLDRSRIKLRVAILKPLSAAISIGSGGPFGAEGPIIMTGGALGSLFAQRFRLTPSERKTLLAAGAAAGMAAIFATPVAAVLLAIELLLFEWKPRSFIPVCVAAMLASVLRVPILGAGPIFAVPAHETPGLSILLFAVLVGLAGGITASLVTWLVYGFEDAFQRLRCHWMWWPAIGALFVGIGGYFEPAVLGMGYGTIHSLLLGKATGVAVLGLVLLKMFVWTIALGSGTSGGVLAPLLIIGASMGALVSPLIPGADAGAWAMIGMAAVMAATMRCPFTAMLFAVELTHDYAMLPAVVLGVVSALLVTALVMKRSILTERLARRGHHIVTEYGVDPFELARVGEAMDRNPPTVDASMRIMDLADRIAAHDPVLSSRQATLVLDSEGDLVGILTRADLMAALRNEASREMLVGDVASTDLVIAFADETLNQALNKMLQRSVGRLPVVDRQRPRKLIGYLGRASILAARLKYHHEEHEPPHT